MGGGATGGGAGIAAGAGAGRTGGGVETGAGAGALTAGAAPTGEPHPVQNFNPAGTLAPHLEQLEPAETLGAATGGGVETGAGVGALTAGAAPTAEPHPVQNFIPAGTSAPHLAHFSPDEAAGDGAGDGAGTAGAGLAGGAAMGADGLAAAGGSSVTGCPQTVQILVPAGRADQQVGHLMDSAAAAAGFSTGLGAGAAAGGCVAGGTVETGEPQPVQNFIPAGTLAPHFAHFRPASAPATTGGAGVGATNTGDPQPVQNLILSGTLSPHLGHLVPPAAGGGAAAAPGSFSPQELQNFCPAGFSFPQPVQVAIIPPCPRAHPAESTAGAPRRLSIPVPIIPNRTTNQNRF